MRECSPEAPLEPAPLDWLLSGEPFVKHRTLVDLLGTPEDDDVVAATRKAICRDPLVQGILDRQNKDGYWGTPRDIYTWWPPKDSTFWLLGALADFGLSRDHERIASACEYVFSAQLTSGGFGWGPPPTPGDCFTGILTESLAKLGYGDDARLSKAYRWLAHRQRLDGGFWCKNTGQPGRPREREPSCAFATLCVLGALTQNPDLKNSRVAERSAVFLLECWDNRGKTKYAGHNSQIGSGWEKLKYPFTDYRILKYLDVLSQLSLSRQDSRMDTMTHLLFSKQDENGRFYAESIHGVWAAFDFGQKKLPSRWISFLVYRIAKRLMSNSTSF